MALKDWKKSLSFGHKGRIYSWDKKNLDYPENESIAVIKSSEGWVVNHAGYNGASYFSDNILVIDDKKEAMMKATWFMNNN